MKAWEIKDLLKGIPDDAELVHIWTNPRGKPKDGIQKLRTKLYFKNGEVKMEVPFNHEKRAKEDPQKEQKTGLTQKLGNFFKSEDTGISP